MHKLFLKYKIYGIKKFIFYTLIEIYRKVWLENVFSSFSQNKEDLIIHKLLRHKKLGFYVDVGANDPIRLSNTRHFYLQGWRGINIEPDIDCYNRIVKNRKNDINLNIGIGLNKSNRIFYKFLPDTLSTFSKKEADEYLRRGYELVDKKIIKIDKLSNILYKHLHNRKIDFLSIDTEGYDLEVLESNNWSKYRPKVICIETVEHTVETNKKSNRLEKYLNEIGYRMYINNSVNSIYIDSKSD